MFLQTKPIDEKLINNITSDFLKYFTSRIEGTYADGNDILIIDKKIMGFTVVYNNIINSMMIRFILTFNAKKLEGETINFYDRKYNGITGVCDSTGIDEDTVHKIVSGFVEYILLWRSYES